MTRDQFRELNRMGIIRIPQSFFKVGLPSDTDPTQDIPVRAIQMTASGMPLNVKEMKGIFSNVKAENLTTIEKRNFDKFDNVGELQSAASRVSKKCVDMSINN